jgi:hypothetical protein
MLRFRPIDSPTAAGRQKQRTASMAGVQVGPSAERIAPWRRSAAAEQSGELANNLLEMVNGSV